MKDYSEDIKKLMEHSIFDEKIYCVECGAVAINNPSLEQLKNLDLKHSCLCRECTMDKFNSSKIG